MTSKALVKIVCGRCGTRTLLTITERPADWSGSVRVPPCPRHDRPRPGEFGKWAKATVLRGARPEIVLVREVPWADLRPLLVRAELTGETSFTSV